MNERAAFAVAPEIALRRQRVRHFLDWNGWRGIIPAPLSADASFRTYYRLADRGRRAVLMDAPPPREDVGPYVAVAGLLRELGFSAPEILAEDRQNGFLLIEDFGDDTYTRLLMRGADETELYRLAVDTLIALHRAVRDWGEPNLPPYDEERLLGEVALLVDWYAPSIGIVLTQPERAEYLSLWREAFHRAAAAPATLVLRDYHVDNLMLLPGRPSVQGCGLLDFQDAVHGPPAYDLVSLLEDARRDVPAPLRQAMTARYLRAFPALDQDDFARAAAILAAQRNAKIIGIFIRLWKRDGKPHYLPHIPRVWRLLEGDLRHPALAAVSGWFERHLPPGSRRVPIAAGVA